MNYLISILNIILTTRKFECKDWIKGDYEIDLIEIKEENMKMWEGYMEIGTDWVKNWLGGRSKREDDVILKG